MFGPWPRVWACRLLVFSSLMTLALNVTDPLPAGQTGRAPFDAAGPLSLIGRAEVGPGLPQAISSVQGRDDEYPTGTAAGPSGGWSIEARRPSPGSESVRAQPGGRSLVRSR